MEKITKKEYLRSKGIAIIATLILLLGAILFFANKFDEWRFISLAYILIVMPHIFGALVYQSLSLKEKGKKYSLSIFLVLLLGLIIILITLFEIIEDPFYFIMIILIASILHVFLNEKTMFEEVYGKINWAIPWSYFFIGQAAIIKSMFSESAVFFYYEPLIFIRNFGSNIETITLSSPQLISSIISLSVMISILLCLYGIFKELKKTKTVIINLFFVLFLSGLILILDSIQFVLLVGFLIIFHVFSWIAYYSTILHQSKKALTKNRKKIVIRYNWIFWGSNIIFVIILVLGNFVIVFEPIYEIFFSNKTYFMIWILVHTVTSFVNEDWAKGLFYRT